MSEQISAHISATIVASATNVANKQLTNSHPAGRISRGVACILKDVTILKQDPDRVEPVKVQDACTYEQRPYATLSFHMGVWLQPEKCLTGMQRPWLSDP